MRERKEVQEVLRCLTPVDPPPSLHTRTRRFRTDPSAPRKLNLRKQAREDGTNRDGLHLLSVERRGATQLVRQPTARPLYQFGHAGKKSACWRLIAAALDS